MHTWTSSRACLSSALSLASMDARPEAATGDALSAFAIVLHRNATIIAAKGRHTALQGIVHRGSRLP